MQCISPINIQNPATENPKDRLVVPCGKCQACLEIKRQSWYFRIKQEMMDTMAYFVTLTYEDQELKYNEDFFPEVNKQDVQEWIKKFRKLIYPDKLRYIMMSEYGPQTYRPHYHGILFAELGTRWRAQRLATEAWGKGFVTMDVVTDARVNYVSGYVHTKANKPTKLHNDNFALMSRRPGIGANYIERAKDWHGSDNNRFFVKDNNIKMTMPRYYRDRIFSKETKEHYAQEIEHRLDKQERLDRELALAKNQSYEHYKMDVVNDYIRKINLRQSKKKKL